MLKLVDNVDYKKIEKYGFCKSLIQGSAICWIGEKKEIINSGRNILGIKVYFDTGHIILYGQDVSNILTNDWLIHSNLDILYDLIKDGLVEKIENSK